MSGVLRLLFAGLRLPHVWCSPACMQSLHAQKEGDAKLDKLGRNQLQFAGQYSLLSLPPLSVMLPWPDHRQLN